MNNPINQIRESFEKFNKKPLYIIIALFALLGLLAILFFAIFNPLNSKNSPVSGEEIQPPSSNLSSDQETPLQPTAKPDSTVRVVSTGDNLIHDIIYKQAQQRAGGKGYDFKYAYQQLEDIFSLADLKTINQETALSSLHSPSGYPLFNTPQANGAYVAKLGFNVVNHATNHILDKGTTGIESTFEFWKQYNNIQVTGVYANEDDSKIIKTITKNDITFSFIGMTESLNGLNLPSNSPIIINRTKDIDKMVKLIKDSKAVSDATIINVHWGSEYTHQNNDMQKQLAQTFVNAGADVIIGHHPHVIQPVQYLYDGEGNKAVVAYSLGNLISSQDRGSTMIGGLLDYEFTKNHTTNKTHLSNVRFIPIVNHYERARKNIRVYPLDKYTQQLANTHGIKYPLTGYGHFANFSLDYIYQTVNKVIDKQFLTNYK